MPINWNLLDTQAPQKLGALFDPGVVAEKQNRLSDLAAQRDMRQMQMVQGVDQLNKTKQIQGILQQTGGDPEKAVQALLAAGHTAEAAQLKALMPKPEKVPDWKDPEYWKVQREQKEFEAGLRKEKPEKLQFNADAGGFIEPPSAQNPQGRIIPMPGFKPKGTGKPLPTQALKLQQEELDAIGSASALNADLSQFKTMIDSGKLPLGMTSNWAAEAKNYTGMSDEGSRNYASFKANLERLRNESLRLNKGVQTEGDAIRAWNEIVKNINDPELVSQRLSEVAKTNERAIALRKMNVDAIRSNYGYDPMDVSARQNLESAYGNQATPNSGGGAQPSNVDALLEKYNK